MKKIAIVILLIISLVNTQQENKQVPKTCLQNKIDLDQIVPKDYLETFEDKYGKKKLQNSEPQPITITFDFKELDNQQNGDGMTPKIKEYIQKILYAYQTYLNKNLTGMFGIDVKLDDEVKIIGIDNSDLHILVTYQNDLEGDFIADAINKFYF